MYFWVPLSNGALDIDYRDLVTAFCTDTEGIVELKDGAKIRPSWREATKAEFEAEKAKVVYPETGTETTTQKLARLEEQNLILMDALATTFEEILELRLLVEGGSV